MDHGSRTSFTTLALLAVLLAALTGCGSDAESTSAADPAGESSSATASPSPTATPTGPAESPSATSSLPSVDDPTEDVVLPPCASVWVAGQTLPRGYQGCLEGTETVPADGLYCEFGKALFSYGRHFYAVANGPVNRTDKALAKDKTFQAAQRACGG